MRTHLQNDAFIAQELSAYARYVAAQLEQTDENFCNSWGDLDTDDYGIELYEMNFDEVAVLN